MVAILEFPPDLRPATILSHFNALAAASGPASEYETITLGISAAKASIKIARLLQEVNGWGVPTLTREAFDPCLQAPTNGEQLEYDRSTPTRDWQHIRCS